MPGVSYLYGCDPFEAIREAKQYLNFWVGVTWQPDRRSWRERTDVESLADPKRTRVSFGIVLFAGKDKDLPALLLGTPKADPTGGWARSGRELSIPLVNVYSIRILHYGYTRAEDFGVFDQPRCSIINRLLGHGERSPS